MKSGTMKIGIREAIERIRIGYFGTEYGFDLQILVDCVGVMGNILRNLSNDEIENLIKIYSEE